MDLKNSGSDGGVTEAENSDSPVGSLNANPNPVVSDKTDVGDPSTENLDPTPRPSLSNGTDMENLTAKNNDLCPEPLVSNGIDVGSSSAKNNDPSQKPSGSKGMDMGSQDVKHMDSSLEPPAPNGKHVDNSSVQDNAGGSGAKNTYCRADKIDFKNWDMQLDRHLSRAWSKEREANRKPEEWEIDLSKLDLKGVTAHGTYGIVYKGDYDGQDVAVKVLDWGENGMATVAETSAIRASFRQEVAVWHKLDHPNVTKFVGASMGTLDLKIPPKGCSNGAQEPLPSRACCVVVEYLAGGTLKNYLIRNRRRKLAIKVVIQLALDLSRGLSYLHSKKIVHRDVKTENMLLDIHRNLKIADFGVARVEAQNPRDMTGETGTLGYMAPEVLDGKPYNRKCDVYSFGICLWEIYCCDMPYPNLSFADVSSAVVRQNLRPEIPRCCPASLANIMRRCWDANPDKRPDMDEVVRMLEAVDTSKGGGMIPEDQVVQGCFCFGPARGP